MDVWFYEAFEEEAAALRRHLPEGVRAGFSVGTLAEAGHATPPARLISTRTQSFVPEGWFDGLGAVLSRSTGYDHLHALRERGFAGDLGHLPLYCHRAVAEHALLMVLALLRRLPRQLVQFERFERDHLTGRELAGRRVAVFGVGRIGAEVVRLFQTLGMEVRGVDPETSHPHVRYTTTDEALAWAEVVVVAMDLRPDNRGFFDRDRLQHLRRGALFVNVSRGELSPSSFLLEGLETGHLGGVSLDVYDHEKQLAEPLREGRVPTDPEAVAAVRLAAHPQALCTPHNAFNTAEAVERKASQSVEQVVAWLRAGQFIWSAPDERRDQSTRSSRS